MHSDVLRWVERVRDGSNVLKWREDLRPGGAGKTINVDVLEMGSRDWNGTPRHLFPGARYTGVDALHGDGVDLAAGVLANRDTANSEQAYPAADTYHVFDGPLSLVVSNAGASKAGTLTMYYR